MFAYFDGELCGVQAACSSSLASHAFVKILQFILSHFLEFESDLYESSHFCWIQCGEFIRDGSVLNSLCTSSKVNFT